MTNEEALKRVKGYLTDYFPADCYGEVEEIMEALEQQPCDDAISRQAVISTIYDNKSDFKNDFAQGFFADKIRALPSVTPKEKTGKWIDTCPGYYDSYVKNAHCCSNCRNYYTLDWKEMNFCPNCGARMVSE